MKSASSDYVMMPPRIGFGSRTASGMFHNAVITWGLSVVELRRLEEALPPHEAIFVSGERVSALRRAS